MKYDFYENRNYEFSRKKTKIAIHVFNYNII